MPIDSVWRPLVIGATVTLFVVGAVDDAHYDILDVDPFAVVKIASGSTAGPSFRYQAAVRETLLLGEAAQTRSETT